MLSRFVFAMKVYKSSKLLPCWSTGDFCTHPCVMMNWQMCRSSHARHLRVPRNAVVHRYNSKSTHTTQHNTTHATTSSPHHHNPPPPPDPSRKKDAQPHCVMTGQFPLSPDSSQKSDQQFIVNLHDAKPLEDRKCVCVVCVVLCAACSVMYRAARKPSLY